MTIVTFAVADRDDREEPDMPRETLPSRTGRSALADRAVLVTGASGAFGSATLRLARELGARALGLDVKPGDGVLACDVADGEQVRGAVREAVGQLGGLDILIHFAGIGPAVDIGQPPGAGVTEALEVNLLGVWRVTAAALPALLERRGHVIITASLLAGVTLPFTGAYTVSKRALTGYADVLRMEYGSHLRVTTVYPGYVDTPIHDRSRAVGVSLDGLVPAERVADTVAATLRAATAARAPRDVASTRLGAAALRLARHAPSTLDRAVRARLGTVLGRGTYAGAELAAGLRQRLGAGGKERHA
jgi:NAD(P)-dependent dehydrogenase (short-subunit alcohol dehydrogenase family)